MTFSLSQLSLPALPPLILFSSAQSLSPSVTVACVFLSLPLPATYRYCIDQTHARRHMHGRALAHTLSLPLLSSLIRSALLGSALLWPLFLSPPLSFSLPPSLSLSLTHSPYLQRHLLNSTLGEQGEGERNTERERDNDKEAEGGFETVLEQTVSRENRALEGIEIVDRPRENRQRKVSQQRESSLSH